jgi:hypothetical protein
VPFSVVLDTCVLYPAHLRDTLLRLAERDLYHALWSADIVEKLRRNLIEAKLHTVSVDHLIAEMVGTFPDATARSDLETGMRRARRVPQPGGHWT